MASADAPLPRPGAAMAPDLKLGLNFVVSVASAATMSASATALPFDPPDNAVEARVVGLPDAVALSLAVIR